MALIGKIEKKPDGKEEFIATFTNGTVQQLEELSKYLQDEGFEPATESKDEKLADVVKIGISWLERLKERSKKSEKQPTP